MPLACGSSLCRSRASGTPIHDLKAPDNVSPRVQRKLLDRLREKNEEHHAPRHDNIAATAHGRGNPKSLVDRLIAESMGKESLCLSGVAKGEHLTPADVPRCQ